ncbi:MIP/aquaporin family protein [Clostridium gasigenes]|uniref:MIP/aquaporin family protein n=1 Tax=Clostridium gasigenes TaxID=94869 RepID=UPI001C0DD2A4|nr:MIP/aquaporin family protein [Clostridium gasigenes]MBU3102559.1 aquaporin family protein [Clostridium gasigenes]MBU3131177.1 aquaporin family protein [Clostridium gasigenes]
MTTILAELFGTLILVLLGDAVVANVILNKTKGNSSGWIVIASGWAFAVAVPVYMFGSVSGAHFNPAVTLALAVVGKFPWANVPMYLVAQFVGAFLGAGLVLISYYNHFEETEDKATKLGVFCTSPEIRNPKCNFATEFIGTFIFVFAMLGITAHPFVEGVQPFVIGVLVWAIGLSLGGPTGYAINPARDLGPRLMHYLLPVPNKGGSDWGYAWIPVVAPILGAILGALLYVSIF